MQRQDSTGSAQRSAGSAQRSAGAANARPAASTVTLGLAAVCWVITARQLSGEDSRMAGMHHGHATGLGPFLSFVALWAVMMAAMMLPGMAPVVMRRARADGRVRAGPVFVGAYLCVWTFAGVAIYGLSRLLALPAPGMSAHGSHGNGSLAAGVAVIAAGVYELTPLKRYFRRRCRESVPSGLVYGLYCVGSCVGLMVMLMALGFMSAVWMSVITAIVVAQKLVPTKAAIDVPLALAIIGLGAVIVTVPAVFSAFARM
jgi:predicted metal-binding membrane protein